MFTEKRRLAAEAAAAAAAEAGEGGEGSANPEAAQASTEDVDVKLVPTPPQTPKDGSRPSSSRKVISPKTGEAGENVEESENQGGAAGMHVFLTSCRMLHAVKILLLFAMQYNNACRFVCAAFALLIIKSDFSYFDFVEH